MVQPDLNTRGRCAIDEDPLLDAGAGARPGVGGAVGGVVLVVGRGGGEACGGLVRRGRAVVEGFDGLADHVGFADPGALGVREADGDGVAAGLELADEGVHVGGGVRRRGPVIVDDEDVHFGGGWEKPREVKSSRKRFLTFGIWEGMAKQSWALTFSASRCRDVELRGWGSTNTEEGEDNTRNSGPWHDKKDRKVRLMLN